MTITDTKSLLKIDKVATSSHPPIKTIRYCEEVGLLTPTARCAEANYRLAVPKSCHRRAESYY